MIVAILQARMSSTRLPGKVMKPLLGVPMIGRQLERLQRATSLDRLIVATSVKDDDTPLATYVASLGVPVHRGPLHDVLSRFHGAAMENEADHIVRLTADCPLADWKLIDEVVRHHLQSGADYTSNAVLRTYPDGLDVEVMTRRALDSAWSEAAAPVEREHVTPFIHQNPQRFQLAHVTQEPNLEHVRWTVDNPADFAFVEAVYGTLYPVNPAFDSADIHDFEAAHPKLSVTVLP